MLIVWTPEPVNLAFVPVASLKRHGVPEPGRPPATSCGFCPDLLKVATVVMNCGSNLIFFHGWQLQATVGILSLLF